MTSSITLHNITKLEIINKPLRTENAGRYDVVTLKLSDDKETSEITVFSETSKSIELVKDFKELPKEQYAPIDYLEDGCVVVTVNNKCYVYLKESKAFIGPDSFFYLHNLNDNLECGVALEGEYSYSLRLIYKPGTIKTLTYNEEFNLEEAISWTKDK